MLRTIVFLLLMVFAIRAIFISPFGAALAYVWVALFRPENWVWINIKGLHLSLLFGLILVLRSVAARKWPNFTHPLSVGTVLFLITGLIAQTNAFAPAVGWHWINYFARLTLVCLLLVTLTDSPRRLFYAFFVMGSSIAFFSAKAGFMSLIHGGERFGVGLAGAFIDNNAYALASVMMLPFVVVIARNIPEDWRARKLVAGIFWLSIPLMCYTVISTFSREGLLALLTTLIVYLKLKPKLRPYFFGVVVAIAISIPVIPIPKGYLARMETIVTYRKVDNRSALSRLYFWRVGWKMAKANPLGVGMYNFNYAFDKYAWKHGMYGYHRSIHNSHLEALTENGFDGLAVWIFTYIMAFRACGRVRKFASKMDRDPDSKLLRDAADALTVSMAAFVIGGSFIALCLNSITWFTFAIVAALDKVCAMKVQVPRQDSVVHAVELVDA